MSPAAWVYYRLMLEPFYLTREQIDGLTDAQIDGLFETATELNRDPSRDACEPPPDQTPQQEKANAKRRFVALAGAMGLDPSGAATEFERQWSKRDAPSPEGPEKIRRS